MSPEQIRAVGEVVLPALFMCLAAWCVVTGIRKS